jgi:chorismate dehydratase
MNDDSPALLLIGDAALRTSMGQSELFSYDLGEMWYAWTGLPFVFALWFCRNEVAERADVRKLAQQLVQAKELVPACLEQIALSAKESSWMSADRLLAYWRHNISYQFDETVQAGLMLYYAKCFECGLIAKVPALDFI